MSEASLTASTARRALDFGRMVRFSHSIFALPFALASAAIAGWGRVRGVQLLWIVVAMVGARSAAMGFNRLADHAIDARNPRTRDRELPAGRLTRGETWGFVLASSMVLVFASFRLNAICAALSPVALAIVFGYSYTKRFTSLSHLFLGLALAIAPVGAWIAIRARIDAAPVALGLGVLFWVAGFDVIYACQDVDFDRREGLRSIPARLGVRGALTVSRCLHVAAVASLALLFWFQPLHPVYLVGVGLVAALLAYEHTLVRAEDLSRIDAAFFTVNGWIGVLYLATTLLALALGSGGATAPTAPRL